MFNKKQYTKSISDSLGKMPPIVPIKQEFLGKRLTLPTPEPSLIIVINSSQIFLLFTLPIMLLASYKLYLPLLTEFDIERLDDKYLVNSFSLRCSQEDVPATVVKYKTYYAVY